MGSATFVFGSFCIPFLSISSIFQVSTIVAVVAAIYMGIVLPESNGNWNVPVTPKEVEVRITDEDSDRKGQMFRRLPSIEDIVSVLKSSPTISQAAIVAFFYILADVADHATLVYYLKAKFHFSKDQYAVLLIISGIAQTVSQLILTPLLAPVLGEERLLSIGLFFHCAHMFLYGIALASWVAYLAAVLSLLFVFSQPCGKAQGCISGIASSANVVSLMVYSPLTAFFLSERAPFNFPGFCVICIGFASLIAFIQSIMIRAARVLVLAPFFWPTSCCVFSYIRNTNSLHFSKHTTRNLSVPIVLPPIYPFESWENYKC